MIEGVQHGKKVKSMSMENIVLHGMHLREDLVYSFAHRQQLLSRTSFLSTGC